MPVSINSIPSSSSNPKVLNPDLLLDGKATSSSKLSAKIGAGGNSTLGASTDSVSNKTLNIASPGAAAGVASVTGTGVGRTKSYEVPHAAYNPAPGSTSTAKLTGIYEGSMLDAHAASFGSRTHLHLQQTQSNTTGSNSNSNASEVIHPQGQGAAA